MEQTIMESKRKPTHWEIEGAKLLREITSRIHPQYYKVIEFLSDTYFDIQDNGIDDIVADEIRKALLKYRGMLSKDPYELIENIFSKKEIPCDPQYADPRHADIRRMHINLILYEAKRNLTTKAELNRGDMREILEKVCQYYKVHIDNVLTPLKTVPLVRARAMFILISKPKSTYEKIGRFLNRDHSSVIHTHKRLVYKMQNSKQLRDDYEYLLIQIFGHAK